MVDTQQLHCSSGVGRGWNVTSTDKSLQQSRHSTSELKRSGIPEREESNAEGGRNQTLTHRESKDSTWTKIPWAVVLQNKYSSQWRNAKEEIVTPKGL